MVLAVSVSGAPARDATRQAVWTNLAQLEAMAHLACETGLVVHVVVARGRGVVEYARQLARELGLECSADLRARSARIRFDPANIRE